MVEDDRPMAPKERARGKEASEERLKERSLEEEKAALSTLAEAGRRRIAAAMTPEALEAVRVQLFGKKGELARFQAVLRSLPPEARPAFGQALNAARSALEAAYGERKAALEAAALEARLAAEAIDVTLPGEPLAPGARHPLSLIIEEIEEIFVSMGYRVAEGPDVEWDRYNFEMLNIPKDHPAREMQDSFYLTEEMLLRTHTSPVQVREMLKMGGKTPLKIICPGNVYRRDTDDATHSHMFTQVEGLVVGEGVRMSDLKGTLETFARRLFGEGTKIRLRPSYFPFTEPSAEVDVTCHACGGAGCRVCKGTGWLEVLGAGMVHPKVLEAGGYDPERVSGFAFGLGVERIAMIKFGVDDIRQFYLNDARVLRPFAADLAGPPLATAEAGVPAGGRTAPEETGAGPAASGLE
ncbi:phenylalanine--tRNA ligase subunit alpha [Hydrogenibacillus schlegelii]